MEIDSEAWAAIIGGVIGILGSAGVGYWLQRQNLVEARIQRTDEKRERDKAMGYSILFKMIRIHTNLVHLHRHLCVTLEAQKKAGEGVEHWQVYHSLGRLPPNVSFSPDEMAMLLSLKDDDLFNDLASFDEVHNTSLDIFRGINGRHEWLKAQLPARMEGAVGHVELDQNQTLFFRPKMVELNMMINDAVAWCDREVPTSESLLMRLNELLRTKIDIGIKLTPKEAPAQSSEQK